ncbi:MAG: gamma-glutamyltransferase [Candidatus Bathyarchaeota archaeon]|nr:gamma-glutamyltransferase [Candidatus Bathyarchaeota archaeon]
MEPRQGPKEIVSGKHGVVSSSHPCVSEIMIDVLRKGGNAVDAAVAGSLAGPVYEPHMTTISGTVSFLYWDAASEKSYFMDASPILPDELAPFCPHPYAPTTAAAIPGSSAGLKSMLERFGSKKWSELTQPAIKAAREGHTVTSWEYALLYGGTGGRSNTLEGRTFFPSGRQHYAPDGFQVPVGELWRRPDLAKTLEASVVEGPDYFLSGEWAKRLVGEANSLGWMITIDDVAGYTPIWVDPTKTRYKGDEIIGIPPPQRGGFYTGFLFGVMEHFNLDHYTESAEALALMAWVLRRAHYDRNLIHDPDYYETPIDTLLSDSYHTVIAELWKHSRPQRDLTGYLERTHSKSAQRGSLPSTGHVPHDSCELSIVDAEGNWVQMMETSGGGIPGVVVDGVPGSGIGWERYALVEPGGRTQHAIANTMVTRDGVPWMCLGSPGDCIFTVPQVLYSILEHGWDHYAAIDAPRFWPIRDDWTLEVENRISSKVVSDLKQMGIMPRPLGEYHWAMGSMQTVWREGDLLRGTADPRRLGVALGY